MVFDRRFTAASPRYLGFSGPAEYRHRRAMPVTEYLCPLDPALLNGVRRLNCVSTRQVVLSPGWPAQIDD